jgi:hypothetical protein
VSPTFILMTVCAVIGAAIATVAILSTLIVRGDISKRYDVRLAKDLTAYKLNNVCAANAKTYAVADLVHIPPAGLPHAAAPLPVQLSLKSLLGAIEEHRKECYL